MSGQEKNTGKLFPGCLLQTDGITGQRKRTEAAGHMRSANVIKGLDSADGAAVQLQWRWKRLLLMSLVHCRRAVSDDHSAGRLMRPQGSRSQARKHRTKDRQLPSGGKHILWDNEFRQ